LGIAWGLRRENKRRDRLTATGEIKVEKFYDENGQEVDATFLDLTDVSFGRVHFGLSVVD
jgi:ACS family allantoate permease-like MFS transporter